MPQALSRSPRGCRLQAFTFPEALVTIGLLVLFSGAAGVLVVLGVGGAHRLDAQAERTTETLLVVRTLTAAVGEIRRPEWAEPLSPNPPFRSGYWHGHRDEIAQLTVEGDALVLQTPDGKRSWTRLDRPVVRWWQANGRVLGWFVEWGPDTGRDELKLAWGGQSL